jgi:hypothetical protein
VLVGDFSVFREWVLFALSVLPKASWKDQTLEDLRHTRSSKLPPYLKNYTQNSIYWQLPIYFYLCIFAYTYIYPSTNLHGATGSQILFVDIWWTCLVDGSLYTHGLCQQDNWETDNGQMETGPTNPVCSVNTRVLIRAVNVISRD